MEDDLDEAIISYMNALFEKAKTQDRRGDLTACEETLRHLCDESSCKLGALHRQTIDFNSELAYFYSSCGRLAEAAEIWQHVLSSDERVGGRNSRRALRTAYRLGNVYFRDEKYVEAEQMYRRVADGHEKAGIANKTTYIALGSLGYALAHQNKYEEAEEVCTRAIEGAREVLGNGNSMTCNLASGLAQVQFRHFYFLAESVSLRDKHRRLGCVTGLARVAKGIASLLDAPINPGMQVSKEDSNLGIFGFISRIARVLVRCAGQILNAAVVTSTRLVVLIRRPRVGLQSPTDLGPLTVRTKQNPAVEMLGMLGRMCSAVGDDTSACFLLGQYHQHLHASQESPLFPRCYLCDFPICTLPLYGCRVCPDTNLCSDCYHDGAHGAHSEFNPWGCRLHTFLELNQKDVAAACSLGKQDSTGDLDAWLSSFIEKSQNKEATFCAQLMSEPISFWANGVIEKPSVQDFDGRQDQDISPQELKCQADEIFRFRLYLLKWPLPAMLGVFNYEPRPPPWTVDIASAGGEIFEAAVERSTAFIDCATGDALPSVASSCLCIRTSRHETTDPASSGSIYDTKCLDPNQPAIRLLEILPGNGPQIHGRLSCVTFSETLSYEALSYVWGTHAAETLKSIQIDGQSFPITLNLFDALVSLRDPIQPRVLWVDAICINQADNEEKGSQVMMMSTIYKSASRVLIFLGSPQPGDAMLFAYFNRPRRGQLGNHDAITRFGNTGDMPLGQFVDFCSREWWSRIWTQQEYCLALTDPVFHVGRYSTAAANIIADMVILANEAHSLAAHTWNIPMMSGMRNVHHALRLLNQRHIVAGGQRGHISPRVLLHRNYGQSTDPRDVLYARREFFEPLVRNLFPVDYTIPACKLFERMAIWILVFDYSIDIYWTFPYKLPRSCSSPSWVPDFSKQQDHSHLDITVLELDRKHTSVPAIHNRILTIHARSIDTVTEVFELNEPTWLQQASCFWRLDNYFASLRRKGTLGVTGLCKYLHRVSSNLRIPMWSGSAAQLPGNLDRNHSISMYLGNFTITDYHSIVEGVFDSVTEELEKILKTLNNESLGGGCEQSEKIIASRILYNVLSRLLILQGTLYKSPRDSCADLLGAAVFDYQNLETQFQDLRKPRRSAASYPANVRKLVRSYLQHLREHEANESLPVVFPSPSMPSELSILPCPWYEDLQAATVDCKFEEEVLLRSSLVLRIAREINRRVLTSDLQAPAPPSALCSSSSSSSGAKLEDMDDLRISNPAVLRREPNTSQHGVGEKDKTPNPILTEQVSHNGRELVIGNPYYIYAGKELSERLKERTVFVTNNAIIGMGTVGVTDIRVGDEIVMTELSNLPLILRPTIEPTEEDEDENDPPRHYYYEHVGFACVRGLVDGGFHKLKEHEKPERKVFRIR